MLDHHHHHQPAHVERAAGADGGVQLLSQSGAARQDHLDRRCDQRRAPRLGHRRRLVRPRVQGLRLRVPGAQGAHRHVARAVEIVRSMWTQPHTIYEGKYYRLQGAQCDPKPLQQPHPPIWIGGGGEQLTLRVVARLADRANFGGKPDDWARKAEILKQHCKDVDRDYDEIVKTTGGEVYVRETEEELAADFKGSLWGEPFEVYRENNLAGTPEQVCEKIQAYVDRGCTGFCALEQRLSLRQDAAALRREGDARVPLSPSGTVAPQA